MLKITRRAGERIILTLEDGRTIAITIVGSATANGKIRSTGCFGVGIDAPRSIRIDREEVMMKRSTRAAEGAAVPEE